MVTGFPISTATASSSAGSSSSGGGKGLWDVLSGVVADTASFASQLFVWDELADRGQLPSNNNQTAQQTTQQTVSGTATSGSFIKGVPNEMLFIGLGVVVVLLLLMKVK